MAPNFFVFSGNNRVQLESDKYIHWQPADWTSIHGMDRFFSMDNNGILTVNDQGLFLIYAQVQKVFISLIALTGSYLTITLIDIRSTIPINTI